jgi:hypothetical protein
MSGFRIEIEVHREDAKHNSSRSVERLSICFGLKTEFKAGRITQAVTLPRTRNCFASSW